MSSEEKKIVASDDSPIVSSAGVPVPEQEDTASFSDESDDDRGVSVKEEMPLLSYTRIFGSLPRGKDDRMFTAGSTCSVMAQVILLPEDPATPSSATPVASPESDRANAGINIESSNMIDTLLSQQPHFVAAMGFENGAVELVDARTGVAVVPSGQLKLRESSQRAAIVGLSMDSSGTFLVAIDGERMAVVFEIRYTTSVQPATLSPSNATLQSPPTSAQTEAGVFSNFMSAWGGSPAASNNNGRTPSGGESTQNAEPSPRHDTAAESNNPLLVPRLASASIQMSRISYPRSFGVPTCIVIDPSYKRKRDKSVLVGFLDGRLVLTKRGFPFSRRSDAIIYQGTYQEGNNHKGIEAIEWRGQLAAWADARYANVCDF